MSLPTECDKQLLGDLVVRAVPLVGQVVDAVHGRDTAEISRLVHGARRDALEVALVTACAMVPDDRTARQLLAWVDLPDVGQPDDAWTDEQVDAAHQLYLEQDRSRLVMVGQIIWRRRVGGPNA